MVVSALAGVGRRCESRIHVRCCRAAISRSDTSVGNAVRLLHDPARAAPDRREVPGRRAVTVTTLTWNSPILLTESPHQPRTNGAVWCARCRAVRSRSPTRSSAANTAKDEDGTNKHDMGWLRRVRAGRLERRRRAARWFRRLPPIAWLNRQPAVRWVDARLNKPWKRELARASTGIVVLVVLLVGFPLLARDSLIYFPGNDVPPPAAVGLPGGRGDDDHVTRRYRSAGLVRPRERRGRRWRARCTATRAIGPTGHRWPRVYVRQALLPRCQPRAFRSGGVSARWPRRHRRVTEPLRSRSAPPRRTSPAPCWANPG